MLACCVAASLGLAAASASADFEITQFDGQVSKADRVTPETQAGAHPAEASTFMKFGGTPFEDVGRIVVDLPSGFSGNPTVTARCTRAEFTSTRGCPPNTQVGLTTLLLGFGPTTYPVYSLVPDPGVPAQFGFSPLGVQTVMAASVRTGTATACGSRSPESLSRFRSRRRVCCSGASPATRLTMRPGCTAWMRAAETRSTPRGIPR